MRSFIAIRLLLAVCLLANFAGLASSPSLSIVMPRSGQQGTELPATFHGDRLGDAQEILFYEPGISVLSLDTNDTKKLKVTFKIASDARLGQHVLRVRTASGISEARTFSVGQYPIVVEKEPNNDFAEPQKINLNTTVQGVADKEDIDYFVLEARKGQRITAEVEAMRLGSALVDCHVAILDLKRFELAAADDSAFALQDPIASIVAPEDGQYVIAIRESSYAGRGNSRYCLHIGEAPRPRIAFPAGGKAGETVDVQFLGDVRGTIQEAIELPTNSTGEHDHYVQEDGHFAPSPNKLRVVNYDNVLEVEPNNRAADATVTTNAVPLAFNGVIGESADIDFYKFTAKKGHKFDVRCVARGIRSPLDSVLSIHDAKGKRLAANDDSGGPDSLINWTVPEDGEYVVAVRDHLRKGGADYVYRIEFNPVTPTLTLNIPSFARNSQERNTVSVPRGNRYATLIRVNRSNFGGDVQLNTPELPEGVTMHTAPIAGNVNEVPVVFDATAEAPVAAKLVQLSGEHVEKKEIKGDFEQTLDLVYGQPNNTVYSKTKVDRMAVAVTEEVPFKISVVQPGVPLVRNGTMQLRVKADRSEGFDAPIKLKMLWNPPGVGSQNEVTMPKGKTEANYSVNANSKAALRTWKLAVLASSDAGNGRVWTSSQLFDLTVAEPFLSMQIPMAAGERGQDVPVLCKLNQLIPFEGEAEVRLVGLPPKVKLEQNPLKITKDSTNVIFNASLADDAPIGQHKSLFCQVVVTQNGEPITHSVGGRAVLRIDAPPKPKNNEPAKQVAKKEQNPKQVEKKPQAKPMSRLEKLRLEARQRAEAQKNSGTQ